MNPEVRVDPDGMFVLDFPTYFTKITPAEATALARKIADLMVMGDLDVKVEKLSPRPGDIVVVRYPIGMDKTAVWEVAGVVRANLPEGVYGFVATDNITADVLEESAIAPLLPADFSPELPVAERVKRLVECWYEHAGLPMAHKESE